MGQGNAKRDMERYRNGYPGLEARESPADTQNFQFYSNTLPSRPSGDFVEDIHKNWWTNYDLLESHHGYIQWVFPLREKGMNWDSQPLTVNEISKIKADPACIRRFLKSYDMQLNFYGVRVKDRKTGALERADNWKGRYRNLEYHSHNYLRITRILKCLGELGFEHYKKPFLDHFVEEMWIKHEESGLTAPQRSCRDYWIEALKDDEERDELRARVTSYVGDNRTYSDSEEELESEDVSRSGSGSEDELDADSAGEVTLKRPRDDATATDSKVEAERRKFRSLIAAQNGEAASAGSGGEEDEQECLDAAAVGKYAGLEEPGDQGEDEDELDE